MEEPQQEVAVEAVELVLAALAPASVQPGAQVVGVAVKEALLLDEVDEHQPVQHHRRVPLPVVGQSPRCPDEAQEGCVLRLELIVEASW